MLGVCLLFVGIVLINNGICGLCRIDGKAASVMNISQAVSPCLLTSSIWLREIIMRQVPGLPLWLYLLVS